MKKLRVLITNHTVAARAGSELYIRDIATSMIERGHTPIVYSKHLGDVAKELRAATIPVIDNLDSLGAAPDLIHGQDHLNTMEAMAYFPETPAVFFCHGWMPWEAAAPRFPRILRYVAVDHTCRDRLVSELGIPEERVRIILNFADLDRFKPRGPLPARPRRALMFSNYVNEHRSAEAVRAVCEREGIALDTIGQGVGKACENPESILGDYDLVFAIARSAIEALAVGAAVVLCSPASVGQMVTGENLDTLRPLNFGIRTLREPLSEAALSREVARYDPEDAAEVSRRMRSVASRDAAVDEILALYREVLEEWAGTESLDPRARRRAEGRDTASYLRWIAPRIVDNERLASERDWIQAEYYKLDSRLYTLNEEASQLKDRLEKSDRSIRALEAEAAERALSLRGELAQVNEENRRLVASGELLQAEISERGQYILKLTMDLSEREQTIGRLAAELAAAREQMRRLTGSLGWRMLSLYGQVKHRFMLPAYKKITRMFGARPGGDATPGTRAPRD